MSKTGLPVEIEDFLREYIRSIEQLEILFLLHNAPERCWTTVEAYQEIRSSERSIAATLEELCARGLAKKSGESAEATFQFSPKTAQLKDAVAQLALLYAERRVKIVEAIYSERVSEVDEFARAFRLRKDPNA